MGIHLYTSISRGRRDRGVGGVSERKEDLAARMRLVKAALDSEPVAIAILRAPELRYLYANAEMRRLAGRDLTGELHTDSWPVEALERLTAILRRVAETGESWIERDLPWNLPRYPGGAGGSGEHKYLTLEVSRVELGETTYLLLTVTETTDEVVTRQQRDVMAERMSEVLESVSDAVFAVDDTWHFTYANSHMAQLCRSRTEDLLGVEIWGALPEARDTEFERACRSAMERAERVRLAGEGGPFGGTYTARIYPAENGLVVYVADTTDRTRARRELKAAHDRFDKVLDGTTDGFWILDRDWRLVHVNRTVAEHLGVRPADLIGRPATEVFRPDAVKQVLGEFARAQKSGRPIDFTTRFDGRSYELRLVPIGEELAVFIRDVTEQAEQQERLAQQARYSRALNEIDRDMNSTLDFDAIMTRMLASASMAIDADLTVVAMLDDDGWAITHDFGVDGFPDGLHFEQHELRHATAALRTRSTIVIDDPATDDRISAGMAEALGLASMIVVPLQRGEDVFGAILFNRASPPRPFSEPEVEFATQLGRNVSLAVQNAWLLERERHARQEAAERAETANLLLTAAEGLSASLSMDETTSTLQGLVARATGRSRVTILHRASSSEPMEAIATSCSQGGTTHRRYLSALFASATDRILERSEPIVVDFTSDPETAPELRSAARECDIRCVLFVPIRRGAEVTGMLAIDEPGSSATFSDREIEIAAGITAEASAAIENAQLYEKTQRSREFSEALNEIDVDINSALDFDAIMRRTLERASDVLDVDGARVAVRVSGPRWKITHAYGEEASTGDSTVPLDALPHARLAAHTRSSVVINDAFSDPRVSKERMAEQDIRSALVVPLVRGDQVLGVLFFNRHRQARPFDEMQVDFARKLAAHVSLAAHNSRIYQEQREIADTLQEALLVMPEHVDHLEFATIYRSAAEAARVGGDFYDLFTIDDHTAGVVIGDVSGKGLDAAVMTSLARNTIRAYSAERMAPSSVIERAGDIVLASSERWIFMSVFYGVIDFSAGVMTYCNAGHPGPVLISPDGALEILGPTAAVAGAFTGAVFGQGHARVSPGDTLLFYTDGLVEARHNGELYGDERLHENLRRHAHLSPEDLIDAVIDGAEQFARALNDDVAVMAVRLAAEK